MRRLVHGILVASLFVMASACGSPTLDTERLQTDLAGSLETQLNASSLTVRCPEDVEVEPGAAFECTATAGDGFEATVRVTMLDDVPNVRWKIVDVSGEQEG